MDRRTFTTGLMLSSAPWSGAVARFHGGGVALSGSGQTLLKTMSLVNTSVGATPTNSHTPMFGIMCKKGDIPSGTWPILKTNGGTVCPYSYWNKTTWSDGSLKFLAVLPIFPDAVAGSATVNLKIYNGGTAPAASSRTLTEVSNAAIQVVGTGWDSTLSGTWTCDLATAITDNLQIVVIGDGPAGKLWRIQGNFKQSGSPHGQLICHFYVWARQDASGNLADFLVLPRVTQPFYDVTSPPADRRNFSSLVLKYGAGPTTFDPVANSYSASQFTWVSGTTYAYSGTPKFNESTPFQCTTTGTLPSGLATGTTYFFQAAGGSNFRIYNIPTQFGSQIASANNGSGLHTMTPGNMVAQYGTQFIATTQGRYVWFQGAGSNSAEATLRVKQDITYDHTTQILPPYNLSIVGSVVSNPSYPWAPQSTGPIDTGFGGTGERPDIGPHTGYQVVHYFTQATIDELCVRTIGLSQAQVSTHFRSVTGNKIISFSDPAKSYTGMAASLTTTVRFSPSGPYCDGAIQQPVAAGWNQVYSENGPAHCPNLPMYAYLFTGEPQYADLILEFANMVLMHEPPVGRNCTLSGITYYGQAFNTKDNGLRESAWFLRNIVQAAGILPDAPSDGSQSTQYAKDISASNFTFVAAWNAANSSWWTTNGYFNQYQGAVVNPTRGSWNAGYAAMAVCLGAGITEDANAHAFAAHLSKWPVHRYNTDSSTYALVGFVETDALNNTTYISDDAHWAQIPDDNHVSLLAWDSGTQVFTITGTPNWTMTDGDKYIFVDEQGIGFTPPTNFSLLTPYYAVSTNAGAKTFKLSAFVSGSPITIGSTGSDVANINWFILPSTSPTAGPNTSFINSAGGSTGYGANNLCYMTWAEALGDAVAGSSTVVSDLNTRLNAMGAPNWTDNAAGGPKYYMQPTF